jgi:hypothetical protein
MTWLADTHSLAPWAPVAALAGAGFCAFMAASADRGRAMAWRARREGWRYEPIGDLALGPATDALAVPGTVGAGASPSARRHLIAGEHRGVPFLLFDDLRDPRADASPQAPWMGRGARTQTVAALRTLALRLPTFRLRVPMSPAQATRTHLGEAWVTRAELSRPEPAQPRAEDDPLSPELVAPDLAQAERFLRLALGGPLRLGPGWQVSAHDRWLALCCRLHRVRPRDVPAFLDLVVGLYDLLSLRSDTPPAPSPA